jgi:hypothetical protein
MNNKPIKQISNERNAKRIKKEQIQNKRYKTVSAGVRQDEKHALQPTNITNQTTLITSWFRNNVSK